MVSTASAEMPFLHGFHAGMASTTVKNNVPRGLSTPPADAGYLMPTFGTFIMHEEGFAERRVSPIYADLVAALTYAPEELDEAFFGSGILGHFVAGKYLVNLGPAALGAGLSFGEYGYDSESFDEGYYLTIGPAVRASLDMAGVVANATARYDWAAWHPVPSDRTGPNEAKANGFLTYTLQVILYESLDALYVDLELWKALSDEKVERADQQGFRGVDISRLTLSVGWRFLR